MKATELLMQEHRIIEQVLNCLEAMAQQAASEKILDEERAFQAIDFFRNFADKCHHGKEEGHLFPALEARGFARDGGPTGVMFYEHDQGRNFVKNMFESTPEAAKGNEDALDNFVRNAEGYIHLLREHIQKEDHCLFPMADEALDEKACADMMNSFTHVEEKEIGEGVHESYIALANTLATHYNVSIVKEAQDSSCGCGCNHN
ncbi:MAG: hemerythrin domain-containing protein [Candidatus Hinthialibacter antarcticus]|nr:hemerythrin domain-containing protein [Candidatus Hinthialibacter antarcticus]